MSHSGEYTRIHDYNMFKETMQCMEFYYLTQANFYNCGKNIQVDTSKTYFELQQLNLKP